MYPGLYYICRRVQIMKLLIMHFSPAFYYLIPLRSKYSPQHSILRHPQSMVFPSYERASFTPIQNTGKIKVFVYFNHNVYR
jgi:hypothetical protein